MHHEWHRDAFTVSTDPARIDLEVIHGFLATSYWATGIPVDVVQRSLEHSLNFGLHHERAQIGFARIVSDRATVAYVGDVFVLEPWRGRGLSTWLMTCVVEHPELQGLRRWFLLTRDAQALYEKVGFTALRSPERWMERWTPNAYRTGVSTSRT